jgi:SnoaL-like domain
LRPVDDRLTLKVESGAMSIIATSTVDVDALRLAFATRDRALALDLYADDACVEVVNVLNPPSSPLQLSGRDEIAAYLDDVFAGQMTHEVEVVVAAPDALGYVLRCTREDGTKVVCAAMSVVAEGRIVREVGVQAWDS